MATHSSVLAWRIPWTEEPDGLQSVGHKESDTTEQWTLCCAVLCCCPVAQFVQLLGTPWTAAHEASLFPTASQSLPKVMFVALVVLSSHLIL